MNNKSWEIHQQAEAELEQYKSKIKQIDQEISVLKKNRDFLIRKRDYTYRILSNVPSGSKGNGTDPLGVSTAELAPVVAEWIEQYNRENNNGGMIMLSLNSNVSRRIILNIVKKETKFTTLKTADRLLTAMGKDYLDNGKIRVIPNPYFDGPRSGEGCG